MRAAPLINQKLMTFQLILILMLILSAVVFNPPTDLQRALAQGDEVESVEEEREEGEGADVFDEEELPLSERAPGRLSHKQFVKEEGEYWGRLENGWRAKLSVDPRFEAVAERHLSRAHPAFGAMVLMEVDTGRIIGLSEYINEEHPLRGSIKHDPNVHLAMRALAPGAGAFRLVTYMALLEGKMNPMSALSYHKEKYIHRLSIEQLEQRGGGYSNTLKAAFAEDDLSFLAAASHRHLKSTDLKTATLKAGFDSKIPYFDLPYELSKAYVPISDRERFKTALGLKNNRMSVLQGALMSAMIANGGRLVTPRVVDYIEHSDGEKHSAPHLETTQGGISHEVSRQLRGMMRGAIKQGKETSKVFAEWPSSLSDYKVAGQTSFKTIRKGTFKRYTWFVGFLPEDRPRWAVSVLILNGERWYAQALHIAFRVLKDYLKEPPKP